MLDGHRIFLQRSHQQCRDKETPLHKAALYGMLPVVKTLIEAKVDVNANAK